MPRAIYADPNRNNRASTRWVEDGSYPIHTKYGLSAPQMIGEETLLARLESFSNRKLEERLYHELSRLGGLK